MDTKKCPICLNDLIRNEWGIVCEQTEKPFKFIVSHYEILFVRKNNEKYYDEYTTSEKYRIINSINSIGMRSTIFVRNNSIITSTEELSFHHFKKVLVTSFVIDPYNNWEETIENLLILT